MPGLPDREEALRYFIPEIVPLDPTSEVISPERLGGVPIGLDPAKWPKCEICGKSQSFLAQFEHHPERLDLGRDGRMMLVFQCAHDPGMCDTWEAFSGANAALVLDPEEVGILETPRPEDMPPVDPCATIAGWHMRDDGLSREEAEAFYDEQSFLALGEQEWNRPTTSTRLGGVPRWLQSANEWPGAPWRFVGQLDSTYSFLSPPADPPGWVRPDPEIWEGRTHFAEGPNFGGGGIAYLFIREGEGRPSACMFWQS